MQINQTVSFLELTLHGSLVGYLAGFEHGKNALSFAHEFVQNSQRPTLSLITSPQFPMSQKLLAQQWVHRQRLHPLLSNLLPEGALRTLIAHRLKTHVDNEFQLISYLGEDLPGALVAKPIHPENVPNEILANYQNYQAIPMDTVQLENRFSLAGVQMKFSMTQHNDRYTLTHDGKLGDWIVKTPSPQHQFVPENEYSMMKLAEMVGVVIPEVQLVPLNKLDNLPAINLPNETYAYTIKRFDRDTSAGFSTRIHTEDFAQILVKYPHEKYSAGNYEQIAKILYEYSGDGLADVQQFAKRLLVNILLANGDAHLKNWSVIYADKHTPRLSPAYDIVFTQAYMANEQSYALNLGKTKQWYAVGFSHFEAWAHKAGVPWRAIKPHLHEVLELANTLWQNEIKHLPMKENHKQLLANHWQKLGKDFKIHCV